MVIPGTVERANDENLPTSTVFRITAINFGG
jgi:hypothetical protein